MSVYTPEDFAGCTPPPRVMGTEMEYSLSKRQTNSFGETTAITKVIRDIHGGYPEESFMPNGSRIYADVGNIEYATPECLGPAESVCAEIAGQNMVERGFSRWRNGKEHLYRRTGGIDSTGLESSVGYHQNFLTPPYASLLEQQYDAQIIGAHLVSRVIWSGNGNLTTKYNFSQKAHDIQNGVYYGGPHNNYFNSQILRIGDHGERVRAKQKPLLVWSRSGEGMMEAHADGWERLEVRYADANHSPWARFMSMATTSLVLRLLEHKDSFDLDVWQGLRIKKLSAAVMQISADTNMQQRYEMVSGEKLKALDLQRRLANMALELSQKVELPDDEQSAAFKWREVCDDLDSYEKDNPESLRLLSNRIEWAARLRAMKRQNQRKGRKMIARHNHTAVAVDQAWDVIYPTSIASTYWCSQQLDFFVKNMPAIELLTHMPPRFTRAHRRSAALRAGFRVPVGKWDRVQGKDQRTTYFPDPYVH